MAMDPNAAAAAAAAGPAAGPGQNQAQQVGLMAILERQLEARDSDCRQTMEENTKLHETISKLQDALAAERRAAAEQRRKADRLQKDLAASEEERQDVVRSYESQIQAYAEERGRWDTERCDFQQRERRLEAERKRLSQGPRDREDLAPEAKRRREDGSPPAAAGGPTPQQAGAAAPEGPSAAPASPAPLPAAAAAAPAAAAARLRDQSSLQKDFQVQFVELKKEHNRVCAELERLGEQRAEDARQHREALDQCGAEISQLERELVHYKAFGAQQGRGGRLSAGSPRRLRGAAAAAGVPEDTPQHEVDREAAALRRSRRAGEAELRQLQAELGRKTQEADRAREDCRRLTEDLERAHAAQLSLERWREESAERMQRTEAVEQECGRLARQLAEALREGGAAAADAIVRENRALRQQQQRHERELARAEAEVEKVRRALAESEKQTQRQLSQIKESHATVHEQAAAAAAAPAPRTPQPGHRQSAVRPEEGGERRRNEAARHSRQIERLEERVAGLERDKQQLEQQLKEARSAQEFTQAERTLYLAQEKATRSDYQRISRQLLDREGQLREAQGELEHMRKRLEQRERDPGGADSGGPPAAARSSQEGSLKELLGQIVSAAQPAAAAGGAPGAAAAPLDADLHGAGAREVELLQEKLRRKEAALGQEQERRQQAERDLAAQAKIQRETRELLDEERRRVEEARKQCDRLTAQARAGSPQRGQRGGRGADPEELAALKERLQKAETAVAAERQNAEECGKLLAQHEKEMTATRAELREEQRKASELQSRLDAEGARQKAWEEAKDEKDAQLTEREEEVRRREEQLQQELDAKQLLVTAAEEDRDAARKEAEQAQGEVEALKEELSKSAKRLKERDALSARQADQIKELQDKLQEAQDKRPRADAGSSSAQIKQHAGEAAARQLEQMREELEIKTAKLRKVTETVVVGKELQEHELGILNDCLRAEIADLRVKYRQSEVMRREAETRCDELSYSSHELSSLQQRYRQLVRIDEQNQEELASLRATLKEADLTREEAVQDLLTAQEQLKTARQNVEEERKRLSQQQERLQNLRVKHQKSLASKDEDLKRKDAELEEIRGKVEQLGCELREIKERTAASDELKAKAERLESEMKKEREKHSALQERFKKRGDMLKEWRAAKEAALKENAELKPELETERGKAASLLQENKQLREELEALKPKVAPTGAGAAAAAQQAQRRRRAASSARSQPRVDPSDAQPPAAAPASAQPPSQGAGSEPAAAAPARPAGSKPDPAPGAAVSAPATPGTPAPASAALRAGGRDDPVVVDDDASEHGAKQRQLNRSRSKSAEPGSTLLDDAKKAEGEEKAAQPPAGAEAAEGAPGADKNASAGAAAGGAAPGPGPQRSRRPWAVP
eukprot:TRINITY_DN5647_c7_g1_i1.p1 TRINITY_DN5647_c7_g1~~TRINITY_DN5647_c7_g1_i1.p1  ORF type:complete len:1387 (+),score=590.78 TRINITY_DN5647_c7_g1_i1:68-4228(+)